MKNPWAAEETRLFDWLSTLLNDKQIDLIVPVERKATALLRALIDLSPERNCRWPWSKVLSSDALRYLPKRWLQEKRVLVFNELVRHGDTTNSVLGALAKNTPDVLSRIEIAAYAVHEDFDAARAKSASSRLVDGFEVNSVLSQVAHDDYGQIRTRIIDLLRHRGALLLDTEHIESTFRLHGSYDELLSALSSVGEPVMYDDGSFGALRGVTIRSPFVLDVARLRDSLPAGVDLDSEAPKKVRLVRRTSEVFALIPIWYAPIPLHSVNDNDRWVNAPAYLRRSLDQCPAESVSELAFHLVGVVTGIELLRTLWAALADLTRRNRVKPETLAGAIEAESPLGHLRALYPLIDFDELEQHVNAAIGSWGSKASVMRVRSRARPRPDTGFVVEHAGSPQEECLTLLGELILRRRPLTVEADWAEDFAPVEETEEQLAPFSWNEYWALGERLQVAEPLRTVIMDTAIDSALLKTSHVVEYRPDGPFIVRGFAPDSEFAMEDLERVGLGARKVSINE